MNSWFKDIRASFDSFHLGASLSPESLTIWKTVDPKPITTVQPGFECGRERFSIDPSNGVIYAGIWGGGVTAYDFEDRQVIWHRRDLIGIHSVDYSPMFPMSLFIAVRQLDDINREEIVCGIAELDIRDGQTVSFDENGRYVYLHPTQPIMAVRDMGRRIRILGREKQRLGTCDADSPICNVGFGDSFFALAEGSEGVRNVDFNGQVISHYKPHGRKPHCTTVAFDEDRLYVFDSWDGTFLSSVDPLSGELISEYQRKSHSGICFIDGGTRYVDCSGEVFASASGEREAILEIE